VQENIIGTLTLSISKSVHLSISPIFLHKSYSTATPKHPSPLLPENYICIVALTPNLQRVCFHSETDFLHHSSIMKLLLFPKHINGLYLSSKASLLCGRSSSAMWLLQSANSCMVAMQINTSVKATNNSWLVYNDSHVLQCESRYTYTGVGFLSEL
jgi:hypothetical protein